MYSEEDENEGEVYKVKTYGTTQLFNNYEITKVKGGNKMNKHRVCTTISLKHWEILNNYAKQYETQQKVLESALENMDSIQKLIISPEDKLWLRMKNEIKPACFFHRDLLKSLIDTADLDRLKKIIVEQNACGIYDSLVLPETTR
jgi:hypothetical protein